MDELFEKERKARMDGDITILEQTHYEIIAACNSEDEIIQALRALINKRKQEHESIKKVIRTVYKEHKNVEFLKNLLSKVIEGRIFLEEERIDISESLKCLLGNNIHESYEILKDVPVETFTTISESKRSHFLFEQIRLALLLNNLEDAELFIRKVRKGYLEKEDKVIFLNYCILLRVGLNAFLEASKLYIELNEFDENKKHITLGSLYCIMSSCLVEGKNVKEEKKALLLKFYEFKNNDELMRSYLKDFCSDLIIDFKVVDLIELCVKKFDLEPRKDLLYKSVLEHNFAVISKFFSKIRIDQITHLLNIKEDDLVDFISEMVNEKYSTAKINQKDALIFFENKTWNNKVTKVLEKLVSASYLIHKDSLSEINN